MSDQYHDADADDAIVHVANLTRGSGNAAAGDLTRGGDDGGPTATRGGDDGDRTRQNAFFAVMSAVMSWVLVRGEGGDRTTREDGDPTTLEDGGRTHGVDDGEGNGGGQGNGRLSGFFLRLLACCAANAAGDPEDAAPFLPTGTSSAAVNPVVPPNRFFRFDMCTIYLIWTIFVIPFDFSLSDI